jgi:hypothetical protein
MDKFFGGTKNLKNILWELKSILDIFRRLFTYLTLFLIEIEKLQKFLTYDNTWGQTEFKFFQFFLFIQLSTIFKIILIFYTFHKQKCYISRKKNCPELSRGKFSYNKKNKKQSPFIISGPWPQYMGG